jgi:hypothetical protein
MVAHHLLVASRLPVMRSHSARRFATHDASASAEVVLGPKICLYWNRDGPDVAGLPARGAAHMIRLTWAIAALTLVMLLGLGLQIYLAFHPPISPVLAS